MKTLAVLLIVLLPIRNSVSAQSINYMQLFDDNKFSKVSTTQNDNMNDCQCKCKCAPIFGENQFDQKHSVRDWKTIRDWNTIRPEYARPIKSPPVSNIREIMESMITEKDDGKVDNNQIHYTLEDDDESHLEK